MAGLSAGAPSMRLAMRGIEKRFGGVIALSGVDLDVRAGEVHALVGENGAGKSTLMKVLSGAHVPNAGTMALDGAPYAPRGPLDARHLGVAMIYQELSLAPHLSVEDNVMLGREDRRFGFLGLVARKAARRRVEEALAFLGHEEISATSMVASLGPGARQIVETARALVFDAKVIVMDEPTSSLSKSDTTHLFDVVRRLRDRGVSIIYISHFLEELDAIADRYTVLRDGATVGTGTMADTSTPALVELMVGRSVDEIFPRVPHERGEPVLSLSHLSGERLPRDASLVLHRGEIFGIGGLVGAGRTELLRALFGLDSIGGGHVTVASLTDRGRPPHARVAQGMGLLSEDRKGEGLALSLSIAENATLSKLASVSRFFVLDRRARSAATQKLIEELHIRCSSPDQSVGDLSGGNQQKVAFARLLHQDADVLLLDEPTPGVDVGSKAEIYALIGLLAARGKAILLVSSYVPELLGICDTIAVMHRGKLLPARPRAEWNDTVLIEHAAMGEGAA